MHFGDYFVMADVNKNWRRRAIVQKKPKLILHMNHPYQHSVTATGGGGGGGGGCANLKATWMPYV